MSIICVSKTWEELTKEELYRIIQLRIEGFIVNNGTCYQDLEQYYDHNGWYLMHYDSVQGMHPQAMVGATQYCTLKTFYGDDGEAYSYPAWRRQVWVPGYRNPKEEQRHAIAAAMKYTGSHMTMCEVMEERFAQHIIGLGWKLITKEPYLDGAGRPNWVMIPDGERFKEMYDIK
jgi:hypothetical protein